MRSDVRGVGVGDVPHKDGAAGHADCDQAERRQRRPFDAERQRARFWRVQLKHWTQPYAQWCPIYSFVCACDPRRSSRSRGTCRRNRRLACPSSWRVASCGGGSVGGSGGASGHVHGLGVPLDALARWDGEHAHRTIRARCCKQAEPWQAFAGLRVVLVGRRAAVVRAGARAPAD
eukprot:2891979-Pleurochrysis_carterae.AAC.1